MAHIKSIHVYPIKGMRGSSLAHAELHEAGLAHDRRWMLVDQHGTFLSQRTHAQMTRFVPTITKETLEVRYGQRTLEIGLRECADEQLTVSVFDDTMRAATISSRADRWFSEQLDQPVRLVRRSASTNRIKDFTEHVAGGASRTQTQVSFADGYPYLLLGTASMNLLNEKLDRPLPADRFRANIHFETNLPHEEDDWTTFTLGDARMRSVKPCARCQVTTIDQQTGERGTEPLRTLAGYRKWNNKIYFGANAVMLRGGRIAVGDEVRMG